MKKNITNIKRAVCIMANELHKLGMSLSDAFIKAWRRIKKTMTFRAAGTTFENRQERLAFLKRFDLADLKVTLRREQENAYDRNAIAIIIDILPIRKRTHIGYIPKGLAAELAKVMDSGVCVNANLAGIIGGYDYKDNLGALLNVTI